MNILYVNDQLVDLNSFQVIAITIKGIEPGKITSRVVSHTNSFTVPATENNDRIFGYTKDERSRSSVPYRLNSFKLIQNGIETFSGKLVCKAYKDGYKVQLLEEVFDVFAAVKNKRFKDLETFGITGWTPSDIDSYRNTTEGIVSALLFWGKTGLSSGVDVNFPYNENLFLPSFYYHTVIKSILEFTGLTLSGDILTDARFTQLAIPFPGDAFRYPDDSTIIINYDDSSTSAGQSILSPTSSTGVLVQWPDGAFGLIDFDQYNAPTFATPVTVNFQISLVLTSISFTNATTIYAKLIKYDGVETVIATSIEYNNSAVTISFNNDIVLNSGEAVYVKIFSNAASSPTLTATLENTSTFVADGDPQEVSTAEVNWDLLWPEITCDELLTEWFVRYGIVFKTNLNTIYFKTIDEIILDRVNVNDWSTKLVKSGPELDFTSPMAQTNYFNYNDQVLDEELGRGEITIDNETLPIEDEIYLSIFENCIGYVDTVFGFDLVNMAEIKVFSDESETIVDFDMPPGLKICTLKARTTEPTFEFDDASGNSRSDYYIAYFVDERDTQTKDTGYQYFVDQFYVNYEAALQRHKIVTKYYYLDEIDIKNFDTQKLIWDGEGYYLLDKISNFIPNQLTKVELISMNPFDPSDGFLLLETEDYILLETRDKFKLQ